ncbi:hypothetical protein KVT40_005204 [Elsinoe batatas]|uniref:S-formylglutathione hydrolase n=1 Tax=Elsinoe batatas TaxID=2601811 RepID=A0A8K0L0N5_9PEZI|nr:hypothetical protein KVT40_005204 [Elsinoe batatas]
MSLVINERIACFDGEMLKCSHSSQVVACDMAVNVYLPSGVAPAVSSVPVLMFLSGLTCTPDNCSEKGFFQCRASQRKIAMAYPDTSPRGLNVPGEDDEIDLGTGASCYVDATREPWNKGYRMYTYLTEELPAVLSKGLPQLDPTRLSLTGMCVGGHGAMMLYLKNPGKYRSCSAFAPVANPSCSPWGRKAFAHFFGEEAKDKWKEHDSTELVKSWKGSLDLLIDLGSEDHFDRQGQLLLDTFAAAVKATGVEGKIRIRKHAGHTHSYYFMSTFAHEHVDYAADALLSQQKSLL